MESRIDSCVYPEMNTQTMYPTKSRQHLTSISTLLSSIYFGYDILWHVIAPKAFLMVKSEIFSYKNADFLETHRKILENQGFGIVAG